MKQLPKEYIGDELSHATMRTEDLIPRFMEFLHKHKNDCGIIKEVDLIQDGVDALKIETYPDYSENYHKNPVAASYILNEDIWELLNDIAPEFSYFGSSEGDGSAYGFWTDEERLHDKVIERLEATIEVSDDLEEVRSRLEEIMELMSTYDR